MRMKSEFKGPLACTVVTWAVERPQKDYREQRGFEKGFFFFFYGFGTFRMEANRKTGRGQGEKTGLADFYATTPLFSDTRITSKC